jgi:isoquinoline 1-oxidoreductase subunit beta
MADNPTLEMADATPTPITKEKRKGVKRRAFLVGGAALLGGGIFAMMWGDSSARKTATLLLNGKDGKDGGFPNWLRIGADDSITVFSPHIDFGQGSHTALAQMLADELDADWSKVKVETAPADPAFANTALAQAFVPMIAGMPALSGLPTSLFSMLARNLPLQLTGGSSAVRFTGQMAMRALGAGARMALIEEAAERLNVPISELTAADSIITHAKSGKTLRYGELAAAAAQRSISAEPKLKTAKEWKYIGKPVARLDIPAKVDGTAKYSIDVIVPDMRVASIMMAPVRDGKLLSVDLEPAMAVSGVEKVIKLDDAVVVVAKGYWQAQKGLQALSPKFSDGGHAGLSTAAIYAAQDKLNAQGDKLSDASGGKIINADYKVPYLHQAMMEPWAMVAHYKDGKLEAWGGLQDPLSTRKILAKTADLSFENVTYHQHLMGGGFGRRFPDYSQIIGQIALISKQVPYPVKLIWSREEEVKHGAYRPQVSGRLQGSLGKDGKIAAWASDYAQFDNAGPEGNVPYTIPNFEARHHEYISNQVNAYWRSVNASQHGFFNESFVDELAHQAGEDPYQFRRKHLPANSRHLAVLDKAAKLSGWDSALPAGTGRGIAIVESFGTIIAEVVEATTKADGSPKVIKVTAVVDCGTTVNPKNAEAQIQGSIIMGLSSAIGEAITIEGGAVQQNNFSDYPVMMLADAPPVIDVHFIESGADMGGIGEPGLPPAAPALANALFAATGKRIRSLPILLQAKA